VAAKYVYSGAAGAGTGADWANAYTTLTLAFAGMAAGDTAYVANDHAETTAGAVTLTTPGTAAAPCNVICVSRAGSVPPVSADLATTATVTTTGANALTFGNGYGYWYGITFSGGSGATTVGVSVTSNARNYFKSCKLKKAGTTNNPGIILGANSGSAWSIVLDNTTVEFGGANDGITLRAAQLTWINTPSAIQGANVPNALFGSFSFPGMHRLIGVDLSALGSGKTLVSGSNIPLTFLVQNCKLGASVTVAGTNTAPGGPEVYVTDSDSSATNYRSEKYATYMGSQVVETTIVRTGGASDGTTGISWKIVTTANTQWHTPFECVPIVIWNETTGSAVTLTLEGIWGGGAVPNNDDVWMDVAYQGSSATPVASIATSTKADILAAGTPTTSSSQTWGGSTTKFKMAVTITPQMKGPIAVYVKAAKASSTFYVDPKITLS
jgi:hypothetical protein